MPNRAARQVRAAAASIAAELCNRLPELLQTEMFDRWLLRPFLELQEIERGSVAVPSGLGPLEAIISEERVSETVDGLHALLTLAVPNPSVALCAASALEPLFRLFVKSSSCGTAIKSKVHVRFSASTAGGHSWWS